MYLFDASAIVNLVKKGVIRPLADGVTLDLAFYEAINAVWKEHRLLRKLDKDVALAFVGVVGRVFEVMKVLSIKGLERGVFELAIREGLTTYDAAYAYVAMKNGFTLVTDDSALRKRISKYLKTISSSEFISR